MSDYAKVGLRMFAVAIAMLSLTLVEIYRPDVIERVDRILSRFACVAVRK